MREALLLLADDEERRNLIRVRGDFAFRPCISVRALNACLHPRIETVICGTGLGLADAPGILEKIDGYGIKLVIHGRLTDETVRELLALSLKFPDYRVSLRLAKADDSLLRRLARVIDEPDGGPIGTMLSRLIGRVPDGGFRFVAAALVLGRNRTTTSEFAATCGLGCRSLQSAAQHLSLPSPHRLLAWGQACWMTWRMDRNALNLKQAAIAGGFPSASGMTAALTHVTGKSPRALMQSDSFALLSNVFE